MELHKNAFVGAVVCKYAGWPNVFSAMPVAKGVFDARPR